MEIRATQKFVLESPKKLREVVDIIRSTKLKPIEAFERLEVIGKRAGKSIRKVIGTAIANAKQANLNVASLTFKEILVNEGPVLKRYRAGSRGRAKPYKKRMSHVRIILTAQDVTVRGAQSQGNLVTAGDSSEAKNKRVKMEKGKDKK